MRERFKKIPSSWMWTGALYTALLLYVAIATSNQRGFIFDDPFIFFRYARNLASGHGWVYNVGQSGADAATSPLFVVILAIAYKLGFGLIAMSRLSFIAGLAACACLTHATLARLGHWWAGAVSALLLASSPWLFITRGMETTLFLGVLSLCVYLWVIGSGYGLGMALATLVLVRPDGIVFVVLIVGATWIVDRHCPSRALVAGGVIAGLWAVYAYLTIGRFLPNTLSAKVAQGRSGLFGSGPIFVKGLWQVPQAYRFGTVEAMVAVLGIAGLAIAWWRKELRLTLGVVAASVFVVTAIYAVLNVPFYPWYYAPLAYLLALSAGIAIEEIGTRMMAVNVGWVAVPATLTVFLVLIGLRSTPAGPPRPGYMEAAAWIDHHTAQTSTIAASEIGILGWQTNHPMDDYLGLLTANAVPPMEHDDMTWWVNGLRPDYWMTTVVPNPIDIQVLESPWFNSVFRKVYRNSTVIVYKRIGLAPNS